MQDRVDDGRVVFGEVRRSEKRNLGTGRSRNLGDAIVVGGNDKPVDRIGSSACSNRIREERMPTEIADVLPLDPLGSSSCWNNAENVCFVNRRSPGVRRQAMRNSAAQLGR
jgi:hypothetical protein